MYLYCFITSIIFLNIWLNLIDIIETTYYIQKTFLFFFYQYCNLSVLFYLYILSQTASFVLVDLLWWSY